MHKDPIQLIQLVFWAIPVIVVLIVFSYRSGRAWNFILSGYVLAALRVLMKFLPWHETVPAFKAFSLWTGTSAMVLIGLGYLEIFAWTIGETSMQKEKGPFAVAAAMMAFGAAYLALSPKITDIVIINLMNIEEIVWILASAFVLMVTLRIKRKMRTSPVYAGLAPLAFVFATIILWKCIGLHLRIFNIQSISPADYRIWNAVHGFLEGLVGVGIGCAFLYLLVCLKYGKRSESA
jgi:hypothetical protein